MKRDNEVDLRQHELQTLQFGQQTGGGGRVLLGHGLVRARGDLSVSECVRVEMR